MSDTEARIRRLNELPRLVEEYLADLPYLIGERYPLREYETVLDERTPENPLGLYTLAPDRIRYKTEEEMDSERRAALSVRAEKFRGIYSALGLAVVIHADRSIEIRWESQLSGVSQGQPWVL